MSKIIKFPVSVDMECRHFNNKLDKEIQEIHDKMDKEIAEYGSMEEYGEYIMRNFFRGIRVSRG